jgi:hypothetical protein
MENLVLNKASEKPTRGSLQSFGKIAQIFGENAELEPMNSKKSIGRTRLCFTINDYSREWRLVESNLFIKRNERPLVTKISL